MSNFQGKFIYQIKEYFTTNQLYFDIKWRFSFLTTLQDFPLSKVGGYFLLSLDVEGYPEGEHSIGCSTLSPMGLQLLNLRVD